MALKQPPSLIRELTSAKFDSHDNQETPNGIYKCSDLRCKICQLYLVECTSFKTANDTEWVVKSHITCNSREVIYFQICSFCNTESNIGKTVDLRSRINNHISACRLGNSTDKFDNHVYKCPHGNNKLEPYFKLMIFMEVNDTNKLVVYENYLQKQGHDTINRNVARSNKHRY